MGYILDQNCALVTDVKVVLIGAMSDTRQTGATQYHAQLELPNKGRAIKGVGCLQWFGSRAYGPGKRSSPRLLLTYL